MKQPKYFEKAGSSFLFSKRLNSKHGIFPMFKSKLKKKLAAATVSEATIEAFELSCQLDHLQRVCLKDAHSLPVNARDMDKAAITWTTHIAGYDLDEAKQLQGRRTKEAIATQRYLEFLISEVATFFQQGIQRIGANGFENELWLTTFGDHLVSYLREGAQAGTLLDAMPVYLKQTNRSDLPETAKVVKDTRRLATLFASIVGEKSIEQINARDVEAYIATRLRDVKTTSVQREISTLRAVWHKGALAKQINKRNPFAEALIPALGSDSKPRKTPTVAETISILVIMEEKWSKNTSYVSAIIAIAVLTGARLGEIWGLEPKDWNDGTLEIRPNATRPNLKTRNSVRPFPALPELDTWLGRFFSCKKPGSANSASAACNKALNGFVVHEMRHGFKQRLIDKDAPLSVIEELQGWSSQKMAHDYGKNTVRASKTRFVQSVYEELFEAKTGTAL